MSEAEKNENCVMESRETCGEDVNKDNSANSSRLSELNESQDFHLIDPGDESLEKADDETQAPQEAVEKAKDTSTSNIDVEIEKITGATEESSAESESTLKVTLTENTEKENADSSPSNAGATETQLEEDDVIQCTPPDARLPPKMQLSTNTEITKLKRKAESFEELPRKILRTTSAEDALSCGKQKLEVEESCPFVISEDSSHGVTENCVDKNVIIAETQDDETMMVVTEEATRTGDLTKEEKSIESHTMRIEHNKDENFVEKSYEIDKNENINESSKLSDAHANKESTKKLSTVENIEQVNDTVPSTADTEEKDKAVEPAIVLTTDESKEPQVNHDEEDKSVNTVTDNVTVNNDHSNITNKENCIEFAKDADKNLKNDTQGISASNVTDECSSNKNFISACKSRKSVEVVFDNRKEVKSKSKELVEIDEEGEKIVLDSSQEDSDPKVGDKDVLDTKSETIYKSCYETSKSSSDFSYKSVGSTKESSLDSRSDSRLVNGSSESKKCDTDSTVSVQSDMFSDIPGMLDKVDNMPITVHCTSKPVKSITSVSKDIDSADLLSVSDNEPDVSIVDDSSKNKSDLGHSTSLTKALQVEREVGIYVKMKCLLHIDEATKEFVGKEVTSVHCEALPDVPLTRHKTNDTSASLADISGNDNKDSSPGSVNSNPQLYQLNPSRLSFASTVSSLSSVSSAASLAAKIAARDSTHFSLPRGPAKHAKKILHDSSNDKQQIDEMYERLTKEWQNARLLTTTVLNFANAELTGIDTYNVSNERIDDQLQKIRSSTPEVPKHLTEATTPKSTKRGKAVKRPRSKSTRSDAQSNGLNKISPTVLIPLQSTGTPSRKKNKAESGEGGSIAANNGTGSTKSLAQDVIVDELLGKEVFAKWSDNNYYPGTVIDKVKTKYKVNFYDGKNKVLIEDFLIPIPKILNKGLSVYATTKADDYGSCGIIVDTETVNDEVYYMVATDEQEKLRVQVKDIFLSSDQANILKDALRSDTKSLPATPKHLGQVTLDNMVDGKRRSRRIATPNFSTPKSRLGGQHSPTGKAEPSVSGFAPKLKKEKKISDNEGLSSDSSVSIKEDYSLLFGIQPEIIGTPNEQIVKGPQSRIKSKSRSKKKQEDEETIANLGPIPAANSNLFKGMSFILTCASVESIDRYQSDSKDSGSDPGTENEEEWSKKSFVRERLETQITAGGGKVYNDFDQIPQEEYKNTKLITNVPNTTVKYLLCLSVGIPAYNHNWIIRCCQEGKVVNPAEDELPAGWSLDKKSYVEMFQRPSNKPLTQVVVIIPVVESEKQSLTFWRQICENAGAVVLLADRPDTMEGFVEGTIVLSNHRCPSWAVEKAIDLQIPLLSTTWVVQSLIEGKECPKHTQLRYKYNYKQN